MRRSRPSYGLVLLAALAARPARGDALDDAAARVARGDVAAALPVLADAYRRATADAGPARLFQDLRREAGEGAALLAETKAAWPEPQKPLGQYLLARLTDAAGVDAALDRVVPLLPDPTPALLDQAWAALASDHLAHAASVVVRLKKPAAGREEFALLEARLLEAEGQRAVAERGLATYVAAHPDAVDARRAWVGMLLDLRRRADAVGVAEEALARERIPPLLVLRASVALALDDTTAAGKCLDEAATRGRPGLRAEAEALRSRMLLAARDVAGATAAADRALAASPVSVDAIRAKARCEEVGGKVREALDRVQAALAANPTAARLWLDRGVLHARLGAAKEARKFLAEARKRDPDLLDAPFHLGILEEEDGDWVGAERTYRAVLKQDPDHVEAHRMLAGVLVSTGKLDPADKEAQWILERRPKDAEAWTTRGRVAYRQDRLDDALAHFQHAVEADAAYAMAHLGRGWVLEKQDKKDEAKKAYFAAITADAKFALPHRYLAELLDDTGEDKAALEHFKAYLDLGGEDPDEDVRHSIERLSK